MITGIVLFVFGLLLMLSESPWAPRRDPDVDERAWAMREFRKRRES